MLNHPTKTIESAGVAALLFAGLMPMLAPVHADTITYNDLTDAPTLIHDGTDTTVTVANCPENETTPCIILLSRPDQSPIASTIPPSGLILAEDPQLQQISDAVSVTVSQQPAVAIVIFVSFFGEGVTPCAQFNGCQEQETGLPQGGTLNWSGGGIDDIFIQSDLEAAVPEPATWLLLATGLIGLLGCWRLKSVCGGAARRLRGPCRINRRYGMPALAAAALTASSSAFGTRRLTRSLLG